PDALEDRVDAEAAGELVHAFDRLVAALADDVRRAELLRERGPVRMPAEDDDVLGAQAPRGDHPAQADGPVADDGRGLPGYDPRGERGVMARPHHVRES